MLLLRAVSRLWLALTVYLLAGCMPIDPANFAGEAAPQAADQAEDALVVLAPGETRLYIQEWFAEGQPDLPVAVIEVLSNSTLPDLYIGVTNYFPSEAGPPNPDEPVSYIADIWPMASDASSLQVETLVMELNESLVPELPQPEVSYVLPKDTQIGWPHPGTGGTRPISPTVPLPCCTDGQCGDCMVGPPLLFIPADIDIGDLNSLFTASGLRQPVVVTNDLNDAAIADLLLLPQGDLPEEALSSAAVNVGSAGEALIANDRGDAAAYTNALSIVDQLHLRESILDAGRTPAAQATPVHATDVTTPTWTIRLPVDQATVQTMLICCAYTPGGPVCTAC